jgi:hypothetical protein
MAVNLSPVGGVAAQFFNNNGVILTGGKIFTYAAGTTTPQTTFTSASGSVPHSNPIILDASGRVPGGEIWLTDGFVYKFLLKDANDVLIGTYDNITGINSNFINYTGEQEIQTATAGQTVFTLTTMDYQPGTNSLTVFVDGVNQYGPGAQYAYVETSGTVITFVTGLHVGASVKFTTTSINSASYGDAFQISYTPPFAGSVATNVGDKLAQTVSVKDFGAVGDGVTDDTAAIQAAINAAYGKTLFVPAGSYYLNTVTNSALLSITNRIQIVADFGAEFRYGTAAGATDDVIRIDPLTIADEGVEIDGLWILEKTGSPARDVIKIYLDATHGLKKLRLTNCLFRAKNGYAIRCLNPTYANANGLFFTDIDKCELIGGFYSDGHGDTTRIANSVFTGQNRGIEIEMLPATAPAATSSQLHIYNNNITSLGGAIFIRRGRNVMIEGNNIEQVVDFENNYCVQLNYLDEDAGGVSWVRGNKIEPSDPTSKCGGLGMFNCIGTIVEGNQIGSSAKVSGLTICVAITESELCLVHSNNFIISDDCYGLSVDSTAKNISYIAGNIINITSSFSEVVDQGEGTKGVFKTVSLQNSWADAGGAYETLKFIKNEENTVLIEGVLASGTLTSDTLMFTLPSGFRPDARLIFLTSTFTSGGVFGRAVVRVDNNGSVRIRNSSEGAAQLLELSLCGISFYANNA